jgi:hypothetical protein
MILSHSRRFIFFAIPKTGTHSVRQALRAHLGPEDAEQVGLFEQKRLPHPELARFNHGHLTAQQVRPVLGDAMYDGYFKFAFVRNPYDRFVSYCAFISRGSGEFARMPREFMAHVLLKLRPTGHLLFRPQHEFVTDADGKLDIDFVGRNETMQASYDAICARLGVPSTPLGRVNATSERPPYTEFYTPMLVDLVGRAYARDLELFGYRYGEPADAVPAN